MKKPKQVQRCGQDDLCFFPLEGLLPAGQALSVNITYLIVSLVSTNSMNGSPILRQQSVIETDMRLLLLLLESPYYCPQEVLRASLFCSYSGLLAGLFSPNALSKLRFKLHPFGLEIVLIEACSAYALMPLRLPQEHARSNSNSALLVHS